VWGVDAYIEFLPKGSVPPSGAWQIVVLDTSDLGSALGYHDLTTEGLPLGKVFAVTDKLNGTPWTATLSHEIVEMLVDPQINRIALLQTPQVSLFYAYEVGDACQSDKFSYLIDDRPVSDFLYPEWFQTPRVSSAKRLDFGGYIERPFESLPGGFNMVFDATYGTGWHIIAHNGQRLNYDQRPHVGSRRERRRTSRVNWIRSQPGQQQV
jgi:hypothetical protein